MFFQVGWILGLVFLGLSQAFSAVPASSPNTDSVLRNDLVAEARVFRDQGYRARAVELLQQAEALSEQGGENQSETGLLLAQLHFELGNYPTSLEQISRILDQSQPSRIEAQALNIRATVQSILNSPKEASKTFAQAYAASASSGDRSMTLTILTNHLRHELDNKNPKKALGIVEQILPRSATIGLLPDSVEIQISIADLLIRFSDQTGLGQYARHALVLLKKAESTAKEQGQVRLQSYAVGHQGRFLIDQSKLEDGIRKLTTANFLANTSRSFESAYLWQWQLARAYRKQGKIDEAIAGYQTAITTLEKVRTELINGSPFTFPQKVQPLFAEFSDLLLTAASEAKTAANQQDFLNEVQMVLEQSKSAELQDYFQNDCVVPDQAVDLKLVEAATAVLYPVILADRLEILVNIGDEVHQFIHQIEASDLEQLANDFRYNLEIDQGDDEYKALGEELYDIVFADLESLFQANNVETLLVIPDGILRTIPFAAIYDGGQYMIEKYAIATTPGISLTFPKPLDAEDASFFAGGISHAVQGFSGLPGVPSELDKLEDQHGAKILHNEAFQLSTIETQLGSEDYSIVHIATHGHFDSNPQQSYLLTYDGKLTMDLLEQSIGSRRQTGNTLDLLVLSACETAVGDNRAALGLAGVALKAGARSAVATLWQISDAATVLIVGSFYEYTSKGNRNKAEALRSAQTKLIDSERYSHPSDWAPFLLIGNWL